MILSDKMLLIGTIFLIMGPLIFLGALIQYIRLGRKGKDFILPHSPAEKEFDSPIPTQSRINESSSNEKPSISVPAHKEESPPEEMPPVIPEPARARPARPAVNIQEQTMMMPPGVADLQAQFEIAITQIKHLNRKVNELEQHIEILEQHSNVKLETNELKNPPMDPTEFTNKLMKLVEHVLVLEKEMARLKGSGNAPAQPKAASPSTHQPPVMPL